MAHTKGNPVAVPIFFADPTDPKLRVIENSFLLGPLMVCASTISGKGSNELPVTLPKGIWLPFDFGDPHPDLPNLYLQDGSIIPTGPRIQNVNDSNPNDPIVLLVALDEHGKAEGTFFEDAGDGYEFNQGAYLLSHYVAELQSSVLTVKVSKTEGSWKRPKRDLNINLLLGEYTMIELKGVDGEELHFFMSSIQQVSDLVIASKRRHKELFDKAKPIPEFDEV